jgi:broad specificity phosphatase PhoE
MVALNQLADCGVTVIDYASGQAIDLDSFEGRLTTTLKAEFSEEFRSGHSAAHPRRHATESGAGVRHRLEGVWV